MLIIFNVKQIFQTVPFLFIFFVLCVVSNPFHLYSSRRHLLQSSSLDDLPCLQNITTMVGKQSTKSCWNVCIAAFSAQHRHKTTAPCWWQNFYFDIAAFAFIASPFKKLKMLSLLLNECFYFTLLSVLMVL